MAVAAAPATTRGPMALKEWAQLLLLGAIWGGQSTEQVEYVRVFVGQLRKKLEPEPSSPRYIVTEPWVGYRFEPGE